MQTQWIGSNEIKRARPIVATLAVAGAFLLLQGAAIGAGPNPVNLGAAAPFAILSAGGITAFNNGLIDGDIGASPAPGSVIQVAASQVSGTIYATDSSGPAGAVVNPTLLNTAKSNLATAYNSAAGRTPVPTGAFLNPGSGNIAGLNLGPGLYKFTDSARVVGLDVTLTGGADDVWIFQIASNFYLGQGIYVILAGGAQDKNIFWQVGNTVLLDEFSQLHGTIMARNSIAMMTNATVEGRVLSMNGSVEFGGYDINVPPGSTVTPPPVDNSLWGSAIDYGNGWKSLSWFGFFIHTGGEWIWHAQHGWMYSSSESTSSLWLWTSDMGWLWTTSTYYPYMYRNSTNQWLWYQKNSQSPRWFYNLNTKLWEKH